MVSANSTFLEYSDIYIRTNFTLFLTPIDYLLDPIAPGFADPSSLNEAILFSYMNIKRYSTIKVKKQFHAHLYYHRGLFEKFSLADIMIPFQFSCLKA
jgi:hypothetical protein